MGINAAMTGLTQKQCIQNKIPHVVNVTHPRHHAAYYPGSQMMHIKLITNSETGKILGNSRYIYQIFFNFF